jgi:hypothetical protein
LDLLGQLISVFARAFDDAATSNDRRSDEAYLRGWLASATSPLPPKAVAYRRLDPERFHHMIQCMKTITINVSEPVYDDFQQHARKMDRKASELIREAMELYRELHIQRRTSLRDRRPASVGGPIRPITEEDDLLGDMLDDARD